ncbi:hypothetical protein ACIBQ1_10435 [Nonomuraea sp. NPDC050153]|uniref:hypothetical protein n=1 Tax=Nonomuraea sp. NPDC050153 TaxID=3364359 RepID=UPI003796C161
MYKHAIAAFAATSGLLLNAGPAAAEEGTAKTVSCSDNGLFSYDRPLAPLAAGAKGNVGAVSESIYYSTALGPSWSSRTSYVGSPQSYVSYDQDLLRRWLDRARACGATNSTGVPTYKAGGVVGLVDGLFAPVPARPCTTAASAGSLLTAIGVTQLFDQVWTGAVPCVAMSSTENWASAETSMSSANWTNTENWISVEAPAVEVTGNSSSLLDALGVTTLVNQILRN